MSDQELGGNVAAQSLCRIRVIQSNECLSLEAECPLCLEASVIAVDGDCICQVCGHVWPV